ncbi:hypothetical protein BDF22DRAFT_745475 [Syncephalis plumigaleata]|nr:hypothetical protein BDF22DRAFT_745475 [Syncephalis plumigaleata]
MRNSTITVILATAYVLVALVGTPYAQPIVRDDTFSDDPAAAILSGNHNAHYESPIQQLSRRSMMDQQHGGPPFNHKEQGKPHFEHNEHDGRPFDHKQHDGRPFDHKQHDGRPFDHKQHEGRPM